MKFSLYLVMASGVLGEYIVSSFFFPRKRGLHRYTVQYTGFSLFKWQTQTLRTRTDNYLASLNCCLLNSMVIGSHSCLKKY